MWAKYDASSTKRGYGRLHRKRRKALLPFAYGKPCPMCGQVMEISHNLDLDHSIPVAMGGTVGDRIVHRTCNIRAGAKLGNEVARSRRPRLSRDW